MSYKNRIFLFYKWIILHAYKRLLRSSYAIFWSHKDDEYLPIVFENNFINGNEPNVYEVKPTRIDINRECIVLDFDICKRNIDYSIISLKLKEKGMVSIQISRIDLFLENNSLLESFKCRKPINVYIDGTWDLELEDVVRTIHLYYYPLKGHKTNEDSFEEISKENK